MKSTRSLGAIVLLALLSPGCNSSKDASAEPVAAETSIPSASESPKSLSGHRVEVAIVSPSTTALTMSVPGEVEGNRDAALAAPLGGYVERVRVDEGDRVRQGQVLVEVDRATHEARQARARVELASAQRELTRLSALAGSIPQVEIDAAGDRVKIAEATLAELALNASRALVVAPFSGVVVTLNTEVGEVAAPGVPLLRLVQLNPVRVSVALSDRDVALAKVGAAARIFLDARAGAFEGRVKSISPAANLKTRSFEALIEVANDPEVLLPGMIANVELRSSGTGGAADQPSEKAQKADAVQEAAGTQLIISQDWLVTRPGEIGVFVEQDSKAVWRPIKLGDIVRKQVVVKEGLNAGDALIIVGHRELVDGDQILVHRRGKCCVAGRAVFSE